MTEQTNCPRGCGSQVYAFLSKKTGKNYYCNTDSYKDFHNCGKQRQQTFPTQTPITLLVSTWKTYYDAADKISSEIFGFEGVSTDRTLHILDQLIALNG